MLWEGHQRGTPPGSGLGAPPRPPRAPVCYCESAPHFPLSREMEEIVTSLGTRGKVTLTLVWSRRAEHWPSTENALLLITRASQRLLLLSLFNDRLNIHGNQAAFLPSAIWLTQKRHVER